MPDSGSTPEREGTTGFYRVVEKSDGWFVQDTRDRSLIPKRSGGFRYRPDAEDVAEKLWETALEDRWGGEKSAA